MKEQKKNTKKRRSYLHKYKNLKILLSIRNSNYFNRAFKEHWTLNSNVYKNIGKHYQCFFKARLNAVPKINFKIIVTFACWSLKDTSWTFLIKNISIIQHHDSVLGSKKYNDKY